MENSLEMILSTYSPFPMCIINGQGKIIIANNKISEVFIYDGIKDADFFVLTGIKYKTLLECSHNGETVHLSRNDKIFKIIAKPIEMEKVNFSEEQVNLNIALYFIDITMQERFRKKCTEERTCMVIINVDNFDELISGTSEETRLNLKSQIDKTIRTWAHRNTGEIIQYREYSYYMIIPSLYCDKIIENKFSILDDIREIETEVDFPVTLSIGIGINGKTPEQTGKYAKEALDLALGRGGDQAVVKDVNKIEYYGGKSQSVEKGNKGKSRIVAHAMLPLIDRADKIIIMGHRMPDMDSIGAALGINRMALSRNKDSYIIINYVSDALGGVYQKAKEVDAYNFITGEKALSMMTDETLLVVVDTHRPSYTDCPQILEIAKNIVVIDHHRKTEEVIENAILTYMESYASSASELVTEMLQYLGEKKNLTKLEVESLLAGITVDTNRFSVKTGVRTFEAASWLRRAGADTTAVKRLFQTSQDAFMAKARSIADADFYEDGIAISINNDIFEDAQILNSQIADELMTVKGVKASFVASIDSRGKTVISARSLGEKNVQVIMEKMGGGGHLTTAGAQTDMSPAEVKEKLLEIIAEDEKGGN